MPSIRILQFGGIRPAIEDRLLSLQKATVAHNTELRRGDLCPYEAPTAVAQCSGDSIFYLPWSESGAPEFLCDNNASFVMAYRSCRGTDEAVAFFRDGRAPRAFAEDGTDYPLLVPAPTQPASLTLVSDGDTNEHTGPDARAYTYTWVDALGVESRPAPASPSLTVRDGATVSLALQPPPPDVVSVRIYRTDSPLASGYDQTDDNIIRSTFQLVREVDATSAFTDTYRLVDLWHGGLTTMDQCDPPTMEGVASTEAGYLVGFTGRTLLFSEVGEPHNWPMKYRFELADRIVGIAVWQNSVFVGTSGRPYRFDIAQPTREATDMEYRIHHFDDKLPLLHRNAITATDSGAAMSTRGGVAALDMQMARLVTKPRIDEDIWNDEFAPTHLYWSGDRLYGWGGPIGGFILGWAGLDSVDIGDLVTIGWRPVTAHAADNGRVYYLQDGQIWQWDAGPAPMGYRWRSRVYRAQGWMRWAAAKVVGGQNAGDPVTFRLFGDGSLYYEREVTDIRPFRLPCGPRGIEWVVEIEGRTCVREVHVATSIQELTELGGETQE